MRNILLFKIYQVVSLLAGLVAWPFFYWHLRSRGRGKSFLPRLGFKLPDTQPAAGEPRIWIHGVSVGEVLAAVPLVQELKNCLPQAAFIITTGTETGQAVARKHFGPMGALVCYFPLDLPWAVCRYLNHLQPQLFIGLESEIWPNFLSQAHGRGVPLTLVNARLSDKSFRRYLKYRRYVTDIINLFDIIITGSRDDYQRFRELGISPHKLHFAGNLKCDRLPRPQDLESSDKSVKKTSWAAQLGKQNHPVFLAASTHPGEEEVVLKAYQTLLTPYPALLLLLAPRHPERAADLGRLLDRHGLPWQLWSRLKSGQETRRHPVVIIDTIGDLFLLYGLADVTFVGGSLVPHGGQNILEPAAWGRVPIYGPYLENFRWAKVILEEAGAGILVHDAPSLAAAAQNLLDHPELRHTLGLKAQSTLSQHQGAAHRQARLLMEVFGEGGQGS